MQVKAWHERLALLLMTFLSIYFVLGGLRILFESADFGLIALEFISIGIVFALVSLRIRKSLAPSSGFFVLTIVGAVLATFAVEYIASTLVERESGSLGIEFEKSRISCRQSSCEVIKTSLDKELGGGAIYTFKLSGLNGEHSESDCHFASFLDMPGMNLKRAPLQYDHYRSVKVVSRTRLSYWLFASQYSGRVLFDIGSCNYQ
jgi:hypothetical protein